MTGSPDLSAAIDLTGWERLLAALVRTPSHPGIARQEERAASLLADWLAERGVETTLDPAAPGRPNVIAHVEGRKPGRHLVLCGHTDTVPLNAGEPGAGFSAEVRDGLLWGRGACDMKGGLTAMAAALAALAATGSLSAGELTLAAVVDEEMQSLGAEHLVASGIRADGAIVGEPTGNRLALGHRGLEWLEVSFRGRAAHGGTPSAGINAVAAAARFVTRVEDELLPALARRAEGPLGAPTLNVGTIRGGDQPSTVAAECVVTLDRRTVVSETFDGVLDELERLLAPVREGFPGLATSIRRVPGGMATLEHRATLLAPDHALARAVAAARADVVGADEPSTIFPAWTDASLLSHFAGIPSVVLGPGDLSVAHSPREHVPLAEVRAAARIYAGAAIVFCGSAA
ncbi:MAG TPA: M20 family metallopeptidase [Candidatus Polarisedimenticolaceae bacterium]|nr:M20 family metallopeptidase [Candidatus Polarisedimenticolaceae bacterium]